MTTVAATDQDLDSMVLFGQEFANDFGYKCFFPKKFTFMVKFLFFWGSIFLVKDNCMISV